MPIAQRKGPDRTAVLVGIASLIGIAGMFFLATRIITLAEEGELKVSADQQTFSIGKADERAADQERFAHPFVLPDPLGGDRDVYVIHVGDEPTEGWHAFAIRSLNAPRDCYADWQTDPAAEGGGVFVDNCDGTTYPATGEGLPQYVVEVDADGELVLDLLADQREADGS